MRGYRPRSSRERTRTSSNFLGRIGHALRGRSRSISSREAGTRLSRQRVTSAPPRDRMHGADNRRQDSQGDRAQPRGRFLSLTRIFHRRGRPVRDTPSHGTPRQIQRQPVYVTPRPPRPTVAYNDDVVFHSASTRRSLEHGRSPMIIVDEVDGHGSSRTSSISRESSDSHSRSLAMYMAAREPSHVGHRARGGRTSRDSVSAVTSSAGAVPAPSRLRRSSGRQQSLNRTPQNMSDGPGLVHTASSMQRDGEQNDRAGSSARRTANDPAQPTSSRRRASSAAPRMRTPSAADIATPAGDTVPSAPLARSAPPQEGHAEATRVEHVMSQSSPTLLIQLQSAFQDFGLPHQAGTPPAVPTARVIRVETTGGPLLHILSSSSELPSSYASQGTTTNTGTTTNSSSTSKSSVATNAVNNPPVQTRPTLLHLFCFWFFLCFLAMFMIVWPLANKLHARVDDSPEFVRVLYYL
ncbi:hypothetical protein BD626DRAFT_28810 [Schizophyllum amplum]|uniref:Uncharacterized protein n=1 Tax=Schizophyllum amplum TaxID=97359 RepID=A0A550D070_9AGAR|nr:hypothetical protein BD626DRAFT_28810 [Auriculariopsis ampla]